MRESKRKEKQITKNIGKKSFLFNSFQKVKLPESIETGTLELMRDESSDSLMI